MSFTNHRWAYPTCSVPHSPHPPKSDITGRIRKSAQNNNGVTFKADITQLDARTTYRLSVQGGYTQDVFTSQNLGFRKYYRATGSITHFLDRRLSIGCLGSVERAESELSVRPATRHNMGRGRQHLLSALPVVKSFSGIYL